MAAVCQQTGNWLSRQLGDGGCVIVRTPWVIGSDLGEAELDRLHQQWIEPAARAMASSYFTTPPDQPITVLLFSSEAVYRDQARRLFGEAEVSRYGCYRPHLRVVVTHVGYGPGPLQHELTHALMAFDFPGAPDWFCEGLASLHEDAQISGGELKGLVNVRLPILQETLRHGRLPRMESFLEGQRFFGPDEKLHYAHARYLCLYLQQQGLLRDYYRSMRDGVGNDPRGRETLAKVFSGRRSGPLEDDFRRWVLELKP